MTANPTFDSYSNHGEDVVLWRALGSLSRGRYVELGAVGGATGSLSKAFYDVGWSGLLVAPDREIATQCRIERPRDVVLEATTSSLGDGADFVAESPSVPRQQVGSLLDALGWLGEEIHFMSFHAEAGGADAVEGVDLAVWRPWIVVVGTTISAQTRSHRAGFQQRMADAGYEHTMFDGSNCWFVSEEKATLLAEPLGYPACPADGYTTFGQRACKARERDLQEAIDSLAAEVSAWRSKAVTAWASVQAALAARDCTTREGGGLEHRGEIERLRAELAEMRSSTSWQVTAPLRRVTSSVKRRL